MMNVNKLLKRIRRILIGKKGIYGEYGKGNKFLNDVYMIEGAKIGSYNYFGPRVMLNNVMMGNYCSIGPEVKLGQGEHSIEFITTYQKISKSMINYSLNQKPTIIENDVWLGANVVVKQGIKIGTGAVVGANAVVTRDIPDFAIAVGAPAKIIRFRFSEDKIAKILNSNWFKYDLENAVNRIELLQSELGETK